MKLIIALVGMCGAGKSVVTDYFTNLGYEKIYFGKVTMDKLKENALEVTPENEKKVREGLRREYGMGAYAYLLLDEIEHASSHSKVVLDGLYSWDEYKILKDRFGDSLYVIAVVANKKIRYNRLEKRSVRPFSKNDAVKRDISEIENIKKAGPIAFADYYLLNNKDTNYLYHELDDIMNDIMR